MGLLDSSYGDVMRGNATSQRKGGRYPNQPLSLWDAIEAANLSMLPGVSDAASVAMAGRDLSRGDVGSGLLNALGALPLVPALGGIVKNKSTLKKAIEQFGKTFDPKETGYILDDGSRLDFSGRHYAVGYEKTQNGMYRPTAGKPDYLSGSRNTDHRELGELPVSGLFDFMDQTGAVRYMPEQGVSLVDTNMPSRKQIETVVRDFRQSKTPLFVDVDSMTTGNSIASKEFDRPTVDSVENYLKKFIKTSPEQRSIDLQKQKAYILKTGKIPPGVDTTLSRSEYYEQISDELDAIKRNGEPVGLLGK